MIAAQVVRSHAAAPTISGGQSPTGNWIQVYGRLLQPSYQRDSQGWHSMRQGFATVQDRRRHGVADTVELLRVLPNTENINVHDAEARAREAFAAQPARG
ncbi:MAG: hypothetical protein GEU74_09170 [Nitriliruptorales bacterium]|nr:hypothetical protein [Nitriliruptorales bacterium]